MTDLPWAEFLRLLGPMLLVLGCYELLFVLPLRSRGKRLTEALLELDRVVAGLDRGARSRDGRDRGLAEQLERLGQRIERLAERIGQLELRSESRPYEQAINLAARGGGAERLIRFFGLTEGEASLVRLLHGRSSAKSPPVRGRGHSAPVDTP
jgi:hypothetical protein